MTNHSHSVLYIGVTSDLHKRIHQHKQKIHDTSFTAKYNCDILVYYEEGYELGTAIEREKQLKKRSRIKKIYLIFPPLSGPPYGFSRPNRSGGQDK